MGNFLSQILLLRGLDEALLARVASCGVQRRCERGEAIIWAQDVCEYVYFILEGQVEVYRHAPGGREQMLDRLGAGECFNLVPACLGAARNLANVRALKKSHLLALEVNEFTRLMETEPRFLAGRLEHMTRLIESLSLYSVRQRLARFLIDQADRGSGEEGVRWTQTDMANRLGTVRDVLGRALRKLVDEGALRIERDRIILLDRAKMEKAVEGDE
jgi:CRP/FNR family transcriptional regulator, cyclic AMP receptor protein